MVQKSEAGKTRELLDLVVREVSLVDRAANKRKFLVIKRAEEAMGNFASDDQAGAEQGTPATQTQEIEKAMPSPELKAAIAAALPLLHGKPGVGPVVQLLNDISRSGGYPYPATDKAPAKKAKDAEVEDEETKKAKAKVEEDEDVEKRAAKRFTPQRMEDMKEALTKLMSVMHGVDSQIVKDALEKAMPKGKADIEDEEEVEDAKGKGKGGKAGCAKAKAKEEDPELSKAMTGLQKAIGDVAARVEQIEKARQPATGNMGDTTQVPVKKSMWKGVL